MGQILLLGPDRDRARDLRGLLRLDGHEVRWQTSFANWTASEQALGAEVVIAASDSVERVMAGDCHPPRGFPAPLLVVQQESSFGHQPQSPRRLVDMISGPFMSEELLGRVDALIKVRNVIRNIPATAETRNRGGVAARFMSLLGARAPRYEKPVAPYLEVAARVAEWADQRDAFEPGHSERVTSFCAMIAEGLTMDPQETSALLRAAMLHDIGKVSVPVEVLHQQTPLQENQLRMIRTHPKRGAALIRALDRDQAVVDTVLYHHECPDGSGYYGAGPEKTPRSARALAVAEVYDAMTSSRIRARLSRDEALVQLSERKGKTLDSDCVEALVDTLKPRPYVIPLAPER